MYIYSLDNLEHEWEEGAEYLLAVLQLKAHVEGLDVGEVLQEIEVALEGGVLRVAETLELVDQEQEYCFYLYGKD